ncbi:MAG: hypothetical protein IIZ94_15805 [Prevotella sp.]|nr:hypothetical protein [Prevotella sp.]
MTVLEWLEASTMYSSFTEKNFVKIALDRGISPDADVYDETVVTNRERDLLTADLIYTAVLLRPSNTASLSQSHNGFQKTIGSEQDFYQDDKIQYAIRIYKKYGDEKAGDLEELAESKKIKFKAIDDVMSV